MQRRNGVPTLAVIALAGSVVAVKGDCAGAQTIQFMPDTGTKAILGALAIYPIGNGLGALQYRGAVGRTLGTAAGNEGHKKPGQ